MRKKMQHLATTDTTANFMQSYLPYSTVIPPPTYTTAALQVRGSMCIFIRVTPLQHTSILSAKLKARVTKSLIFTFYFSVIKSNYIALFT